MNARSSSAAWGLVVVLVALCVGWGLAPEAPAFRDVFTPHRMLALTALAKIGCLLAATVLAFACRDRFEHGSAARPAWGLLSLGLLSTLVGQTSLAPFQIVSGLTPFPSVADLYYVLAYPFLIAAFLAFLRAYQDSGLPAGSSLERLLIVGGVGVLAGLVAHFVLGRLASGEGTLLERILVVSYVMLDLILLVPLALVLAMALRMRGGRAGSVWGLIVAGVLCLIVSDVAFGYLSLAGELQLDPYMHASYLAAYALIGAGTQRQLALLRA